MKKIALFLVLAMLLSLLAGCDGDFGSSGDSTGSTSATEPSSTEPQKGYAPEGITLISCRFTQSVTALDKELITESFPDRDGEVYVDMLFYISPTYFEAGNTMPHFSAKIECGDSVYDLEYRIESFHNVAFAKESVPVTGGYVHMFTSLPETVMNMRIIPEVQYSIDVDSYTCQIQPLSDEGKLDNKTELSVGFRDSVFGGKVDFEVVDIRCANYLVATKGGTDDWYGWFGAYYYVDMVLKITNHFATESIDGVFGYIVEGEEMTRTAFLEETQANTKLEDFTTIGPGQTAYVHVYAVVDEDRDEVGLRFNFGGKLYYCDVSYTIEKERNR